MSTESSSPPQWKYDVFLSFRGEDTRKAFTDHLYTALDDKGITTFRDDPELHKGEAISPALSAAIKESRFVLIVLSQNYASSTWCLDELVRILECMKARETVVPIFYNVDPSDVRKQTGSFGEAFANHEERFRDDKEKVRRWRNALTVGDKLWYLNGRIMNEEIVQVKKCGVRMVYEEDAEELWQISLKQRNTKRGLQHYDDDDAASSTIATGASQEEEEQPHPKIFKGLELDGAAPRDQKSG